MTRRLKGTTAPEFDGFDMQRPVEGSALQEAKPRARAQAEPVEVAQQVGVAVGNASHDRLRSHLQVGQADLPAERQAAVALGNRRAVGVGRRVAQVGSDTLLQVFGNDVLQVIGLGVDLVP